MNLHDKVELLLLHCRLDMCRRQYANDVCNRGTAGTFSGFKVKPNTKLSSDDMNHSPVCAQLCKGLSLLSSTPPRPTVLRKISWRSWSIAGQVLAPHKCPFECKLCFSERTFASTTIIVEIINLCQEDVLKLNGNCSNCTIKIQRIGDYR